MARIKIVCDEKWVTGDLARVIQRGLNQDYDIALHGDITRPAVSDYDILHLMIWSLYNKNYPDGFVLSFHHMDEHWSGYNTKNAWLTVGRANVVVVPNYGIMHEVKKRFPKKPVVMCPYPVPAIPFKHMPPTTYTWAEKVTLRKRFGLPIDRQIIGHISSLHQRKGMHIFLSHWDKIKKEVPDIYLAIFYWVTRGGNSQKILADIQEMARQDPDHLGVYNLEKIRPDLPRGMEYGLMDAYFSFSFVEGGPMTAAEAGFMGLPLIVSNAGMFGDDMLSWTVNPFVPGDWKAAVDQIRIFYAGGMFPRVTNLFVGSIDKYCQAYDKAYQMVEGYHG